MNAIILLVSVMNAQVDVDIVLCVFRTCSLDDALHTAYLAVLFEANRTGDSGGHAQKQGQQECKSPEEVHLYVKCEWTNLI